MKRHFKSPPKPARCKATGKARYRDRKTALAVVGNAAHLRAIAERDGVRTQRQECRVYKCEHCGGWHTTSKPLATYRAPTPTTPATPPAVRMPTPADLPRPTSQTFVSAPSPEVTPAEEPLPLKPYPTPNLLARRRPSPPPAD